MSKIEHLTPEQEAELPRFRQRYLDIACGGGRIDREALQSALTDAYAVIRKPAPRLFIFDSPAASMMAIKIFQMGAKGELKLGDQLRGQLGGHLWDQLRGQLGDHLWGHLWDQLWGQLGGHLSDQLRDQLGGQLRGQLWDQIGGQLWGHLWDHLRGQLGDHLWGQLGDQLWGQLGGQISDQLRDHLWGHLWDQLWGQISDQLRDQLGGQKIWNPNFLWGSQDLYWIVWGKFAEWIGVKLKPDTSRHLDIMDRIGRQCEWWWPFDNIVIASQRPTTCRFDGEGRLHREDGPAVEYADGYAMYAWRGLRIPGEWIADGPPEPIAALNLKNVELRRIACEMRGWHNILPALPNAKLIDRHPNPQIGELWQGDLPDHGAERFLKVQCGTGRTFAMPVGPTFQTALEANAATYGVAPQILENIQFRT